MIHFRSRGARDKEQFLGSVLVHVPAKKRGCWAGAGSDVTRRRRASRVCVTPATLDAVQSEAEPRSPATRAGRRRPGGVAAGAGRHRPGAICFAKRAGIRKRPTKDPNLEKSNCGKLLKSSFIRPNPNQPNPIKLSRAMYSMPYACGGLSGPLNALFLMFRTFLMALYDA